MSEENKERTATDILLSIEDHLKTMIKLLMVQKVSTDVLSNKINKLPELLGNKSQVKEISVEATDVNLPVAIKANTTPIKQVESNKTPRRTERPTNTRTKITEDTISKEDIIKKSTKDVLIPKDVVNDKTVTLTQKIVDKNGKSVFLATVEVYDRITEEFICKTNTNGVGKFTVKLKPSEYNIIVKKIDSVSSKTMELVQQNIVVDGTKDVIDLRMAIIQ